MNAEDTQVPEQLREWKQRAERLGTSNLYYRADFEDLASTMPEAVINELGSLYQRAVSERHLDHLKRWLQARDRKSPMPKDEKGLRNLVQLFGHLGRRGWQPFSSHQIVSHQLPEPAPDWSKLPPEMAFLAEPATWSRRYAYVFADATRERIAATVSAEDRAMLTSAAEKVRALGYAKVNDWRRRMGVQEHVEASMVFNLLGVLDALELRYYD